MFLSIALIILLGISLFSILNKVKLPGLLAFLLTGIFLGPYLLDLISSEILNISSELRQIALVVILIRAGLSLDINDLKKVGRPALLLSFLPATLEIIIIGLISPLLFDLTYLEGFIMGSVIAAVSPAVIVPRMIHLIEKKKDNHKKIPQLILAASSIDDIYVITIFSILIQVYDKSSFALQDLILLPVSIFSGIGLGLAIGYALVYFFKRFHFRDTMKVMILFALSFLLIVLEDYLPVSGLLSIIALGVTMFTLYPVLAERLTSKFSKIWVVAEMMLFVLIGAAVDIHLLTKLGLLSLLLLLISLTIRSLGVQVSILKSGFNKKEKVFITFSYLPKATVQAAIGAIPLSMGMPGGEIILAISVLSILITAPIGAVLIDQTADKLI